MGRLKLLRLHRYIDARRRFAVGFCLPGVEFRQEYLLSGRHPGLNGVGTSHVGQRRKALICGGLASRSVETRDGVTISVPRLSDDPQMTGGQRYARKKVCEGKYPSALDCGPVEANLCRETKVLGSGENCWAEANRYTWVASLKNES